MSETIRTNEIKTTDDAILFLKQLPGFACYHRYFETKLAGDFAFELAKFVSKREAEIEQMREALECMKRCENCISCTAGEINGVSTSICESGLMKDGCGPAGIPCWKPQQVQVIAALAAERGG